MLIIIYIDANLVIAKTVKLINMIGKIALDNSNNGNTTILETLSMITNAVVDISLFFCEIKNS